MAIRFAVCAAISAVAIGEIAQAADRSVTGPAELEAAVASAAPGDRLLLAAGAYGALDLRGIRFAPAALIAAADPGNPPVFSSIYLNDVGGVAFKGVRVEYGPTQAPLTSYAVNILGSADVDLDGLEILSAQNGIAGDDAYGVNIRDSARISVRNNNIHDVYRGVAVFDSDDVAIARNRISKVGSDGVVGRGALRLSVLHNYFFDFEIIDMEVQHPDAIQLWSRDAQRPNEDILIRGNLIRRAAGDPSQGVFIKTTEIATIDLKIEENLIEQSMGQGIFAENINGARIQNNTVIPYDFRVDKPGVEIRGNATDAVVTNNIAMAFRMASGVIEAANVTADYFNPWISDYIGNYLNAPGRRAAPDDFSPIAGVGASAFVKDLWVGDPSAPPVSLTPPSVIADLDLTNGFVDRAPQPVTVYEVGAASGLVYYATEPSPTLSAGLIIALEARAALPSAAAGWRLLAAVPNSYDVRIDRNRIRFSVWTASGVARLDGFANAILDFAAHDIATRYDGVAGGMSIAVDGQTIASRAAPVGPTSYNPTQRLYIAGAPWGLYFGDGVEQLKISRD